MKAPTNLLEPNGPGSTCLQVNEQLKQCVISMGPVMTWSQIWPALIISVSLTVFLLGVIFWLTNR